MSDPKKTEPDEDLLEFLGGIDEINDESQDEDFSDFLANTDVDTHRRSPQAQRAGQRLKPMSDARRILPTRRAALAALFAVGLNLFVGRARAESPAAEAPVSAEWNSLSAEEQKILGKYSDRWDSLPADQQQRLVRGTRRWLSMSPEQRERARARHSRWQELTPEQRELARQRWHRFRELSPEQQQRVRDGYRNFKKLTPEQRRQLRERWQRATPEERQRWLERRRARQPAVAAAAIGCSAPWAAAGFSSSCCRGWPS